MTNIDYEKEYRRLRQALEQSDHIRRQWQFALGELKDAKKQLRQARENLEAKVQERTAELASSNQALKNEIARREQIELSMRKLSLAVEQTGSVVVITDSKGIIEYVNPRFTEVTGYAAEEVIGRKPSIVNSGETQEKVYHEMWGSVLVGRHWRGEILNRRKNGSTYWSLLSISPIEDDKGNITHLVGVSEDVSELKAAQARMTRMALFDPLTELPNRRLLVERIGQALADGQRLGKRLAIIFLDLDNFKHINDTLGHESGDLLLKKIANRLQLVVRNNDTVARLGGDEFVVVLKDIDGVSSVRRVTDKILSVIQKPIDLDGRSVRTSTSIGITLTPQDGTNADILMRNADLAMYRAKEKGRNNYQFFTESMNRELSKRVSVEQDLAQAVSGNQLRLYLQPIYSLDSFLPVGVEALLRWQHPKHGLLQPASFIPIAEETNQITEIGEWVIREACRVATELRRRGHPQISVSVNIAPRQFAETGFSTRLLSILREHALPGTALHLEIKEPSLMLRDPDLQKDNLDFLRQRGVAIAVDDFGIGFSSLSQLKRLPLDLIKIDRSFVHNIGRDPDYTEIIEAIIAMAKKFHLKVVAEGVETQAQLDFLKRNGCDLVQGNLLRCPQPAFDQLDHLGPAKGAIPLG